MKARVPQGPSMNAMIKQAQKMQEDMAALQAELEEREYEISAGGGAAKIKINGKKEIVSLEIAPDIVDPDDVETLCDILTAGINEAIKRVEQTSEREMAKITAGMPGMSGFPGLFYTIHLRIESLYCIGKQRFRSRETHQCHLGSRGRCLRVFGQTDAIGSFL